MAIKLKPIQINEIEFSVVGTAPLVQHAWGVKALAQIRLTPHERKKQPKGKRDPQTEAAEATYRTSKGEYGIPIMAFKQSLIGAAHKDIGLEKTLVRKSFFVPCDDPEGIIPIECDEPIIREDIVRVGASQTDLRYRPEFRQWRATIRAEIDADLLTLEDIANLVNRAGFGVGIGEMRPEKGGEHGRFKIDDTQPMRVINHARD